MSETNRKLHWKQNPEAVKADILRVAVEQFATKGLEGTRIDDIALRTISSKRMIYYYFIDKVGLYQAALESVYFKARKAETALDLAGLSPPLAMRRMIEFTFDYHKANPNFVRMISIENVHSADYLSKSDVIRELNQKVLDKVEEIYSTGVKTGLFRPGMTPILLHWIMSALSFYNVSNRYTFSAGVGSELHTDQGQEALCSEIVDMILRSIMTPEAMDKEG